MGDTKGQLAKRVVVKVTINKCVEGQETTQTQHNTNSEKKTHQRRISRISTFKGYLYYSYQVKTNSTQKKVEVIVVMTWSTLFQTT